MLRAEQTRIRHCEMPKHSLAIEYCSSIPFTQTLRLSRFRSLAQHAPSRQLFALIRRTKPPNSSVNCPARASASYPAASQDSQTQTLLTSSGLQTTAHLSGSHSLLPSPLLLQRLCQSPLAHRRPHKAFALLQVSVLNPGLQESLIPQAQGTPAPAVLARGTRAPSVDFRGPAPTHP